MKFPATFLLVMILLVVAYCNNNEKRAEDEDDLPPLPDNEFFKFVTSLNQKLGLEQVFAKVGKAMTRHIREAQSLSAKEFQRDWAKVKESPTFWNIVYFLTKWTWPGMVQGCVRVIKETSLIQKGILNNLEKKCDRYLGKDATVHPFNVKKYLNSAQFSFFVFSYALVFSLLVLKLMTWWNFAVYLALGFLIYHLGGLNLVLKSLLTLTGLVWFIFDVILAYPLPSAVGIVVIYIINKFVW